MSLSLHKVQGQVSKMAQWVKPCAAKLDNLDVTQRIHVVEGESQFLKVVLEPLHMHVPCAYHTHICTDKEIEII